MFKKKYTISLHPQTGLNCFCGTTKKPCVKCSAITNFEAPGGKKGTLPLWCSSTQLLHWLEGSLIKSCSFSLVRNATTRRPGPFWTALHS